MRTRLCAARWPTCGASWPSARLIGSRDLVELTDVADIVGVSRQNMRKLMLAHPGSFPAPVHEGGASIWHLADVLAWLQAKGSYSLVWTFWRWRALPCRSTWAARRGGGYRARFRRAGSSLDEAVASLIPDRNPPEQGRFSQVDIRLGGADAGLAPSIQASTSARSHTTQRGVKLKRRELAATLHFVDRRFGQRDDLP